MSSTPPPNESNDDQEVLARLFGKKVYSLEPIWYIGAAVLMTLAFIILTSMQGEIWLKTVVFFIIVLSIDLFFSNLRRSRTTN